MEDRLCKDCKHCSTFKIIPWIGPTHYVCIHPTFIETNKVTGKIKKKYRMCSDEREYLGNCMTYGHHWEKK
jgi:hypothetical protein